MPVLMRNKDGQTIEVADADVKFYTDRGYEPETSYDSVAREAATPDGGGVVGAANAGARGFWSGLTLGASDVASSALSTDLEREQLRAEKSAHPIASGLGEVAGLIAPAVLTGGATLPESGAGLGELGAAALARSPAGYLGRFAAEGAAGGRAIGGIEGAVQVAAYSGVEGAAQSAGSYVSDVAMGDRELTAEGLAGALGHGFEFGAAAGAVTHGIEKGTIAARRLFARTAEGKAAVTAEQGLAKSAQETLDAQEAAAEAARTQLSTARQAREAAELASQKSRVDLLQVKNELRAPDDVIQRAVPDYKQLQEHFRAIGEDVITQNMDARALLDRGLVNDTAYKGATAADVDAARAAAGTGKARGIVLSVAPSGKPVLRIGDDIARVIAAAEDGLPIKVHWGVIDREPHVLAGTISSASREAEAKAAKLLDETKAKIMAGQVPNELGHPTKLGQFTPEGLDAAAKREIARQVNRESQLSDALKEYDAAKAEMEAVQRQTTEMPSPARRTSAGQAGALRSEAAAVHDFQNGRYIYINDFARTGKLDLGSHFDSVAEAKESLRHLDDAIARHTVNADTLAYRGMGVDERGIGGELKPGRVITDDGYASTSASRKAALDYTNKPGSTLLEIEIPRGAKARPLEDDGLGESELLLPRGSRYEVKSVRTEAVGGREIQIARVRLLTDPSAQSPLERQLAAMKSQLDQGADIGTLSRETTASPRSPRQLERAHEEAIARADDATDVATKQMHLREAAALEEQMTKAPRGRSVVDDIGDVAPAMTRYERAAAKVTELAGTSAPEAAVAHAKAFRAAESDAERKMMDRTARAIDDSVNPLTSPEGKLAKARGAQSAAELDLAKAKVAESEASIGARAAEDTAKSARSAFEAAQPKVEESTFSKLAGMPEAHAIPVIGPMLNRYTQAKLLAETAGRFIGRVPATKTAKAIALAAKVKNKIAVAVDRSLGLVERAAPAARAPAIAVSVRLTKTLERRAFDDGESGAPKGATGPQLAAIRIREVANAATRPDLVVAQVRKEMRDVDDPDLIDATEKHRIAMYAYLNDNAPKGPPQNPFAKREWAPSPADAAQFARRLEVANDPVAAFEALHQQSLTPEAADTLRKVYPKLFSMAQERLLDRVGDTTEPVPYQSRLRNSLLFDVPLDPSLEPENAFVLRSAFTPIPPSPSAGSAQPPAPSIAGNTNLTALYQSGPTPRAMR